MSLPRHILLMLATEVSLQIAPEHCSNVGRHRFAVDGVLVSFSIEVPFEWQWLESPRCVVANCKRGAWR